MNPLYAPLGKTVSTEHGHGTVRQVFGERLFVVLDETRTKIVRGKGVPVTVGVYVQAGEVREV